MGGLLGSFPSLLLLVQLYLLDAGLLFLFLLELNLFLNSFQHLSLLRFGILGLTLLYRIN